MIGRFKSLTTAFKMSAGYARIGLQRRADISTVRRVLGVAWRNPDAIAWSVGTREECIG